jgi:hypothetical protein
MQCCGRTYDTMKIRLTWQGTQMMMMLLLLLLQAKTHFSSSDPDSSGYEPCHRRRADVWSSEAVTLDALVGSARSAGVRLRATPEQPALPNPTFHRNSKQ